MKRMCSTLLIALVFTGCQLFKKPTKELVIKYPPELEQVHELALQRKTDDARIQVENYLNKSENIHWFGHAYFLKGFLYEMDKNYEMAEKFYKQAIQHSANYDSNVQAKALYNLSYVYENSNNFDALITTLNDLIRRRQFFNTLTNRVEIPARLGSIYAAQGKMKIAKSFYDEASRNYDNLVNLASYRMESSEISKSLYYLGLVVYQPTNEEFQKLITKISLGQKYLLASAESSNSVWSQNATAQLKNAYDQAWGMVLSFEPTGKLDPLARKKQKHMGQLAMASQIYDLTHQVMAEEFPLSNINRNSKKIIDQSKIRLAKIQDFALRLNLGPEMTRDRRVRNTPLAKYVEEKKEPVKINKEVGRTEVKNDSSKAAPSPLPQKKQDSDIGKDPNL